MPIPIILALVGGGAGGFVFGKGTESISNIFKWSAVAGAVYLLTTKIK